MTPWSVAFISFLLQMTAWQEILIYAGTVVFGIATNFIVAAFFAGRYKERVDRLTSEVTRYEEKTEKYLGRLEHVERKIAALTGRANGG